MTKRKRSPRSPHYISRVVTKGRVYHYSRPPKGRGSAGIRLPDDRDLAIKAMGQIIGRGYNHAPPYLQFLLVSSSQRAKEAGLEHTLTLADIESLTTGSLAYALFQGYLSPWKALAITRFCALTLRASIGSTMASVIPWKTCGWSAGS